MRAAAEWQRLCLRGLVEDARQWSSLCARSAERMTRAQAQAGRAWLDEAPHRRALAGRPKHATPV
jgi:hypothetical protein